MLTVANPIYDSVFKYLMEDERIARTLLSALLKKDVVNVETRRNEYTNIGRDGLSIFRIDFGATIREADGSQHLVLIELQKTWVETETLRIRQYLGAQYANTANMIPNSREGYAIPMVTVYLLGHQIGDIEEPVLYVRRNSYDYNDREVTKGLPNPFIDSLTHDSIIVQIPLLHGQINNRLDKVLSIFDQSHQAAGTKQMLNIDETTYDGDDEMQIIVSRLLAAASDAQMRHNMNVEDEYFSAIESRDTTIMLKDKKIADQSATINEQSATINEQSATIDEQSATINEQSATINEQSATINEQSATIDEQSATIDEQSATINEQSATINEQSERIANQQEMLRTSIKMLVGAGMSPEAVALNLNKPIEVIRQLMNR